MTKVSIILVNYNTCKLTCACIQSILQYVRSVEYEIIVVDNQSSDNSTEVIPAVSPKVKYIQSPANLGFGRANNLGAKHATGEYLFLLNTDTLLQNDPFPYFINHMEQHPDCGVVGGLLMSAHNTIARSGGVIYSIKKYLKIAVNSYKRHLSKNEDSRYKEFNPQLAMQKVGYVIGADMFMSRGVFTAIGGFDENIFMYFEDVELCNRLHKAGYSAWLIQGPEIIHLEGESSTSQFARLHNTASLMYCIKKDNNPIKFRMFQMLYFLLKLPILFERGKWQSNCEYMKSIFNYKLYLAH